MRLVFLGAPGVGKGTLAKIVAEQKNIKHFSSGAVLREHIQAQSDLGIQAKSYMDKGELVPDDLVSNMLEAYLEKGDASAAFILDGFPRTIEQAEFLSELLTRLHRPLDCVVLVEVPQDIIIKRLTSRLTCPDCGAIYNLLERKPLHTGICDVCAAKLIQRADDQEEVIRRRLETYQEKTEPLVAYYEEKNLLMRIDNSASPEKAASDILANLRDKQ